MTKDELWEAYARLNPKFEVDGAHFTASGLRKFFDQTYDVAFQQGRANGLGGVFSEIFGKGTVK